MLWVDKYRPSQLSHIDLHTELAEKLSDLARSPDLPHLLFYGAPGSGKKTLVTSLLREIFGPVSQKVRVETKTIKVGTAGKTSIEIESLASNVHIELNASESGNHDRYVVQEMVKEIASSAPLTEGLFGAAVPQAPSSGGGSGGSSNAPFKCVVLHEVDRMSRAAQQSLRRTMEKYMRTCRMILICESLSRVIEPLHSRCLCIRVPRPSVDQICTSLCSLALRERMGTLSPELAKRIAISCKRSMLHAVLMLEAVKIQHASSNTHAQISPAVPLPASDWEQVVADISKRILEKQSSQCILEVRERFYELLMACIPPDVILAKLVEYLLLKASGNLKYSIVAAAAVFDHRLRKGSKPIFHLEAFIVQVMADYRQNVESEVADLEAMGDIDF